MSHDSVANSPDIALCPRCKSPIPNAETPGAYPGALSRVDNITEVCSACGVFEAMMQFSYGYVPPLDIS